MGAESSALGGAATGASLGATLGPWGALAGGAIGAGAGWLFGSEAADAKKKAALEQARRADAGNQLRLGEGSALAGASGVESGQGSLQLHLNNMAAEFKRQNDWNVKQAEQGADLSGLSNDFNAYSNLGGSLFKFGQSNNWWQSPPVAP